MSNNTAQTLKRIGKGTLKVLAAITCTAALTITSSMVAVSLVCPFPSQQQFQTAQGVATKARIAGCQAILADFEDGETADGCCVLIRQGEGQVKLAINTQGQLDKTTYSIRLNDSETTTAPLDIIAAKTNADLAALQDLVANSTTDIWSAVTRVEIPAKTLQRGLTKQKQTASKLETGQGTVRVAYYFERLNDYTFVHVSVESPNPTTALS